MLCRSLGSTTARQSLSCSCVLLSLPPAQSHTPSCCAWQSSCRESCGSRGPLRASSRAREPQISRIVPMRATLLLLTAATALVPPHAPLRPLSSVKMTAGGLDRSENQISGRPTPSMRCCLRSCVCAMAWRIQAVDATLSPWLRRLYGVEAHDGPRNTSQDYLTHWLIFTQASTGRRSLKHWNASRSTRDCASWSSTAATRCRMKGPPSASPRILY